MIKMNKKIGVFDSGIGGLTTLEEIKKLLPNEDYIFYADTKNNPYGVKSKEELCSITDEIVKFFLKNRFTLKKGMIKNIESICKIISPDISKHIICIIVRIF